MSSSQKIKSFQPFEEWLKGKTLEDAFGINVKTKLDPKVDPRGFLVKHEHTAARKDDAIGAVNGYYPGTGGDVLCVTHPAKLGQDEFQAAYSVTELLVEFEEEIAVKTLIEIYLSKFDYTITLTSPRARREEIEPITQLLPDHLISHHKENVMKFFNDMKTKTFDKYLDDRSFSTMFQFMKECADKLTPKQRVDAKFHSSDDGDVFYVQYKDEVPFKDVVDYSEKEFNRLKYQFQRDYETYLYVGLSLTKPDDE